MKNEITTDEVEQKKKKPKKKYKKKILAFLTTFLSTLYLLFTGVYAAAEYPENITIIVQDAAIKEGEEIPNFQIEVIYEGNGRRILNNQSGYGITSLLEELLLGEVYTLSIDQEEVEVGSYPIHLKWNESYEGDIESWKEKIQIAVVEGNLAVDYVFGYIEDDLYYNWDGELLKECWLNYGGAERYIGQDSKLNTDPLREGVVVYEFDEEGIVISKEIKADPNLPMIAITVDDGPSVHTQKLIDAMEKYDVDITFFVLGNKINDGSKAMLDDIIRLGGEIGNHSYNHPSFVKLTEDEIDEQVNKSEDRILKQIGQTTSIIRLPYGAINDKVAEQLDRPVIFWSVDTEDWKHKSKEETLKRLTTNIKDGDILLAHDIHEWSVEAIVEAIPILIKQGFQLVTVSELAEARGVEMEAGIQYNRFRP